MDSRPCERASYKASVTSLEACVPLYPMIVAVGHTCKKVKLLEVKHGSRARDIKQSDVQRSVLARHYTRKTCGD